MPLWSGWRRGAGQDFDSGGASGAVELTKRHPTVSLTKQGAASGNLRVNLSWQMRTTDFNAKPNRGLWRNPLQMFKPQMVQTQGPAMVNVDLDLACMYEMQSGSKGVVQPLGNFFGSLNEPPYVHLSGDDRFGSASGETVYINLDHKDDFSRLLIFVYIYDGTPAFDRTHGVVTLYPSSGPRIEITLDERAPQARSCAVVLIENIKGEIVVRREVKYVYGFQAELDRLYGWGLQWGRGYKKTKV
ncbi:TerD family protein [Streptomyces buecherae]|uniref:Tellurium resistance n=1 Tax=Streptomyces buecherae TaxID=2763006 RepID=A0A7G8KI34_9ACTN|nr:Tellurium resistance [Streptomyces buecherae]MBC3986086.1 Tellurium resistance [Streptomyces buecherae]MBC3991027.1 Tellurium resistance [Streptomyces buecherae]QKW49673.1 Tellurium resistance [Streptomyces buecherae]QNJ42717.1 Tellurium resistance [Streptomyces buecherae]